MDDRKDNNGRYSHFAALPTEIFLHICSFLDVKDIVDTLSRVCKRFQQILEDENIWRSRISKRWAGKYPVIPIENEYFDWKGAYIDLEKHWKIWGFKDSYNYVGVNDVLASSTDAVLFLNSPSVCITGSRDRSMAIWRPLKLNAGRHFYVHRLVAHDGWVWRLHYVNDTLFSCSWDHTIKTWTTNSGVLQNISTFRCNSSVLSLASLEGLLLAGDFARTVYAFDPRSKPEPQFTYTGHSRAVLTLGTFKNDIISGSEDKTLIFYDVRMRRTRHKILLGKLCYPNCSYMDSGVYYVGDNRGIVHVFSLLDGNPKLVTSYESGQQKSITSIKHGRGYVLTSSLDGSIKISVPSDPPHNITTVNSNGGEIGGLDYYDGMLAVGSADLVEFWIPKEYSDVC